MRCILLVVGLVSVSVVPVVAQTAQVPYPVPASYRLGWDQAMPETVDRFESRLQGGAWTDVGKVLCGAPVSGYCQPFPTIPSPGTYTFEVRSCNVAGCSSATPFVFASVAISAPPTGVKVVPQ